MEDEGCLIDESLMAIGWMMAEGVHHDPIDLKNEEWNKRIVYAPHVYGPSIASQDYFVSTDFPSNMPTVFEKQW